MRKYSDERAGSILIWSCVVLALVVGTLGTRKRPDPAEQRTVLLPDVCDAPLWYALYRGGDLITVVKCENLPKCVKVESFTPPIGEYFGRVILADSQATPVGEDATAVESWLPPTELCPAELGTSAAEKIPLNN